MKDLLLRLLASVRGARLKWPADFEKWQSQLSREAPELHARCDTELMIRRSRDRFDRMREPVVRDWMIVLQWQNDLLQKEVKRLSTELESERRRNYEERFNQPYGTVLLRAIALRSKDSAQREEAEKAHAAAKKEFSDRKKNESQLEQDRLRHKAPEERLCGDWQLPMTQQDYAKACGVNVKTVQRFLTHIHAKELPSQKKGRGRPSKRYGFDVNLKVLDHLLGQWLRDKPADGVDAIRSTTIWLATCDDPEARHRKLRPLLRKHLRKHCRHVEDPDLRREGQQCLDLLSTKDRVWTKEICPMGREARVVSEAPVDPFLQAMTTRP